MNYRATLRAAQHDPQQLEQLFQTAQRTTDHDAFTQELLACYQEFPDNLLYAAWYYRLQTPASARSAAPQRVNWALAIPLSLLTGLLFFGLSAQKQLAFPQPAPPYIVLVWSPLVALLVMVFLSFTARKGYRVAGLLSLGLVAVTAYVLWRTPTHPAYRDLMIPHLPLLAWASVGLLLVGWRATPNAKFAFLLKSIEVIVTGGVYTIATLIFAFITVSMFQTLGLKVAEQTIQALVAGLVGLVPIVAIASAYDPGASPEAQEFTRGVGHLIRTFPRILLALTLVVLVLYLLVIPFKFWEPFTNRDVLIVYNAMLFAVMGLLVGATPLNAHDLTPRDQTVLRTGIVAVAGLVVVVSLYALSAIVYRTMAGGLTFNRLTIIGWNSINISLLTFLLYRQYQSGKSAWVESLQATFHVGSFLYVAWTLFLVLGAPWLFSN